MPSGGKKVDATLAPGRRGDLDSMRVEGSEPLAPWVLSRQGTQGSYAVYKMDECTRMRFVYFSKEYRGRWEKQSHDNNATTAGRAGCTMTST